MRLGNEIVNRALRRGLGAVKDLRGSGDEDGEDGFLLPGKVDIRGESRLFLDTADEKEWDKLLRTGLFYGVTTNPVLLQRANVQCTISRLRSLAEVALDDYGLDEFMIQVRACFCLRLPLPLPTFQGWRVKACRQSNTSHTTSRTSGLNAVSFL